MNKHAADYHNITGKAFSSYIRLSTKQKTDHWFAWLHDGRIIVWK